MNTYHIYLARWYVNGKADLGLVADRDSDAAVELVRHALKDEGITPDGKIRLRELRSDPLWPAFHRLSHGGRV